MKFKIFALALLAVFLLGACSGKSTNEESSVKEDEPVNIKALVHDYSAGKLKATKASITSHQLIVTADTGKETVYDLSKEEFFVSIAPYVNQTHT